jgi:hypothetical protein
MNLIYQGKYTYCKEKHRSLMVTSKEIGLEENAEGTTYIVISRDHNAEKNHNVNVDKKSFERVEQLRYFGTILMNQNSIHEDIKSRLKSGNAGYNLVHNLFIFQFAIQWYKDEDIQNIILTVVWYGCVTWSVTLREERRLNVGK